jgi:hypothetical protein
MRKQHHRSVNPSRDLHERGRDKLPNHRPDIFISAKEIACRIEESTSLRQIAQCRRMRRAFIRGIESEMSRR